AFEDFQEAFGICFSGSGTHAVLADEIVCADRDASGLGSLIVCFPLAVSIEAVVRAACLDDGELNASLFYLVPVNRSLPVGYVDSLDSHFTYPPCLIPCRLGHEAAPARPSACPEPAGRD